MMALSRICWCILYDDDDSPFTVCRIAGCVVSVEVVEAGSLRLN
jgi:hypothetical protein